MDKPYDFLIVGAGLYGAVFAHEMRSLGKRCLVVDKRNHTGGNIYCRDEGGIQVHAYGAHIFHTNDEKIWRYVNAITPFFPFINSPLAMYKGRLYNLPFNMNTFNQLWGIQTPEAARAKIREQVEEERTGIPRNLEEQALQLAGRDIYEYFIKGYTEKQWGRPASTLPGEIIKRIPLRFTYNNNYFNDEYQGLPVHGYNALAKGLLQGTEVRLRTDYLLNRAELDELAAHTVFTGRLDEYFRFCYGKLEYRGLHFEHARFEVPDYQGNAVINYTEREIPYTRTIEHKHFGKDKSQPYTIVTKEFPQPVSGSAEPYYPVNDEANTRLYKKYSTLAGSLKNVTMGGRLAEYRYYDMHQVIAAARHKAAFFSNALIL